jgi:nucleosome binding factor SPN SPT16 subunit
LSSSYSIAHHLMLTTILQEQEAIYNLLLILQAELLKVMKNGVTASDAYQHALSIIRDKKPELEKHFVKNLGFGVKTISRLQSLLH